MIMRKFRYEDLNQVAELANFSLNEVYQPSFFLTIWEASPHGFIVAEDTTIAGFILGALTDTHTLRILMLCVEESKRGKGVGTALISALIEEFPKAERIFLEVKVRNKTAIKFYERIGFRITDFLPNFYNDGTDGFLMERGLI